MKEVLSLAGSLLLIVLVLVLTYYATRWYARRTKQTASGKYIQVLDRAALGNGSFVVIAKVGEVYYLLGVGDKQVTMLSTLDDFDESSLPNPEPMPFSAAWKRTFDRARKDFGRKGGDDRP